MKRRSIKIAVLQPPHGAMLRVVTDSETPLDDFIPVPLMRQRRDGWTPARQRQFIAHLAEFGSVAAAARACGKSRQSVYRLCEHDGAAGFNTAWDLAAAVGSDKMYERALDRGRNGYAVPIYRGGEQVGVRHRFDNRLFYAACFRRPPVGLPSGVNRMKKQADGVNLINLSVPLASLQASANFPASPRQRIDA